MEIKKVDLTNLRELLQVTNDEQQTDKTEETGTQTTQPQTTVDDEAELVLGENLDSSKNVENSSQIKELIGNIKNNGKIDLEIERAKFEVANCQAEIIELENNLGKMESKLSNIQTQLDKFSNAKGFKKLIGKLMTRVLNKQKAKLEAQIATIKQQIETKKAELETLQAKLTELQNQKDAKTPEEGTTTGEKFDDVWAEFEAFFSSLPNGATSTVAEKETALSYIGRIMESDAPADVKQYWTVKATTIQNEIKMIQNQETGNVEKLEDVWAEFTNNVPDQTSTIEMKELALSYIGRIMQSDAPDDVKQYWTEKAEVLQNEIKKIQNSTPNKRNPGENQPEKIGDEVKEAEPLKTLDGKLAELKTLVSDLESASATYPKTVDKADYTSLEDRGMITQQIKDLIEQGYITVE